MKKHLLFVLAMLTAGSLMAAPVHVLSNKKVAQGYYPQLNAEATELVYLGHETERHFASHASDMYVTNEDLKLVLYKNGTRLELYPHGTDINYICASISPDGKKILFKTSKGVGVCDLNGKPLANLGRYTAPVWYGNDYVVATLEENDGHNFTAGAVVILSLDGQLNQVLTDKAEIAMAPTANYASGQIAYHDFEGNIHLMQINLAGKAIQKRAMPTLKKVAGKQVKAMRRMTGATKANFSDYKIYINPGHGGYGGDDRGMSGWFNETTSGYIFWESQSNLDKGLQLKKWLDELGFQTAISRTQNREEDDKDLYDIVVEANTFGADFMLSIHTNAGGPSNYILQLFRGYTPGDTHTYSDMPTAEHNRIAYEITTMMGNNQYANKIATWTNTPRIEGDKTFARTAMGWINGYGVLRWLDMPGTISEGAMHDYFPETYRLMNMDYKHQEAWNFMKTFCNYYLNYELPQGVVAGQVRDAFFKQVFPPIKRVKNSRDEQNPISGATIMLLQGETEVGTYTTDTCYNGVFFFWNLNPGTYKLRCEKEHYYSVETEIEVKANEISYHDFMINQMRETPPVVTSYSPVLEDITDSIDVATPIVINFNWDMWEEPTLKAFSISPAVEGTVALTNSQRTLVFTPKVGYEKATEYTVTLSTEACHADTMFNNHLQEDFVLKFRTKNRGKLNVTQTYPVEGATDISLTPTIFLLTDAEIKSNTLTNKQLTLVDTTGAEVSISSRAVKKNTVPEPYGSVLFDVTLELKPNMPYTLTVDPTVTDINNVALTDPFVLHFTTGSGVQEELTSELLDELDSVCFVMNEEKSKGVKSKSIKTNNNRRTSGKASNSITYEFNGVEDDEALMLKPLDLSHMFVGVDQLELDVYGDLSHNVLYAEFMTEGDVKLVPITTLDYSGWKHQIVSLDALPIGMEYNFTGLKIAKGNNLMSINGEIYLDGLRRIVGVIDGLDNVEINGKGVSKTLENNIVVITKDGVHYNVLGTVIE